MNIVISENLSQVLAISVMSVFHSFPGHGVQFLSSKECSQCRVEDEIGHTPCDELFRRSVVHFDNSDSDGINLVTFDGGFVSVGIDTSIMSGISDKWSGIAGYAVTR